MDRFDKLGVIKNELDYQEKSFYFLKKKFLN